MSDPFGDSSNPIDFIRHIQEQQAEHAKYHQNVDIDFSHQLEDFWDSLSHEQQTLMASFLESCGRSPDPVVILAVYSSLLMRKSAAKQNVCVICGKNHKDELLEMLGAQTNQPEVVPDSPEPESVDLYKIYRVKPDPDSTTGEVLCTDCGMKYVSLQDRAIKPPDHCMGCFHKSAHG